MRTIMRTLPRVRNRYDPLALSDSSKLRPGYISRPAGPNQVPRLDAFTGYAVAQLSRLGRA